MSHKERDQKQEQLKLGKFNVQVELVYLDGTLEVVNARTWNHAGTFLGLDIDQVNLRVINCQSLRYFHISPQPEFDA